MAYDRREEIRGPLHRVHETSVARVVEELGTELVVLGVRRYELPRLPEEVLREASRQCAGTPQLRGRRHCRSGRDATVVGGHPFAGRPSGAGDGREHARGTGRTQPRGHRDSPGVWGSRGRRPRVDLMQDAMADEMLDPPRFEDNGHEVTVELPLRSAVAPVERAWIRELDIEEPSMAPIASHSCTPHAARSSRTDGCARSWASMPRARETRCAGCVTRGSSSNVGHAAGRRTD